MSYLLLSCVRLRCRWLYAVADDFFTKQLPHNVTWGLTVLYALDAPGDFSDTRVQVRPSPPGLCAH